MRDNLGRKKKKSEKMVAKEDDPKIYREKLEAGRDADAEGECSKQQLSWDGDLS